MAVIATVGLSLGACATDTYDPEPTSVYQWQRRQDEIQHREDDRVKLCASLNKDTDRYRRDCARPGDSN